MEKRKSIIIKIYVTILIIGLLTSGETIGFLSFINNIIWYMLVPILLLVGIFFTIKTGFTQIANFPEMIRSLNVKKSDEDSISGLQAFFIGLASRVGTGNIAGVAIAVLTGGPGSVFWMWIVAIIGSASAFIESTLAQLYKERDPETKYRGGPAYYIKNGIKNNALASAFAVAISIAFGLIFNAVQANTISNSMKIFFEADSPMLNQIAMPLIGDVTVLSIIMAFILAVLVSAILFGGTKVIAKVSSVVVPIMASAYIILSFIVIIMNAQYIPELFSLIFTQAFTTEAITGATFGVIVQQGVKRGLFSNEAGMGSAPNAAASADVDHPVTQGFIQSLGVFVDTLIVCTATAFIILLPVVSSGGDTSIYSGIEDGIVVTQTALNSMLGLYAVYFLTIAIFFFAFSSILGNYFYSQSNIEFLSKKENEIKNVKNFKIIVIIMVVFGSLASSAIVWGLADLFMGIMALINIFALAILYPKAITLLKDYKKQKKEGKTPVFNANDYEEFKEFEIWKK